MGKIFVECILLSEGASFRCANIRSLPISLIGLNCKEFEDRFFYQTCGSGKTELILKQKRIRLENFSYSKDQ